MTINFHLSKNRSSYATRNADPGWASAIMQIIDPTDKRVADIGCGGGIYSLAWLDIGARDVVGIDFSAQMVDVARSKAAGLPTVSFRQGDAAATGLPQRSVDIVFQRALIHHFQSYDACFTEAHRVLEAGGRLIVQDRTPDDVNIAGSTSHIRGYFFECFPKLLEIEANRRPAAPKVIQAMRSAGFANIGTSSLWEIRKTYQGFDSLALDLAGRTGRSILHELNDDELQELIAYIKARVPNEEPLVEKDRWTIWTGMKTE